MDEVLIHDRIVRLKRAGFHRKRADAWQRGALVVTEATLAALDEGTWARQLKRWRQQRRG